MLTDISDYLLAYYISLNEENVYDCSKMLFCECEHLGFKTPSSNSSNIHVYTLVIGHLEWSSINPKWL